MEMLCSTIDTITTKATTILEKVTREYVDAISKLTTKTTKTVKDIDDKVTDDSTALVEINTARLLNPVTSSFLNTFNHSQKPTYKRSNFPNEYLIDGHHM